MCVCVFEAGLVNLKVYTTSTGLGPEFGARGFVYEYHVNPRSPVYPKALGFRVKGL